MRGDRSRSSIACLGALIWRRLRRGKALLLPVALSSLLELTLLASALVGQPPPPIVVTDNDFDNYDWRVRATASPSTRDIAYRSPSGGNLGAYRAMDFDVPPNTFIFTTHIYRDFTYDPEAQGPIDSIDFSIDLRWFSGSNEAMEAGFALIQDGTIYVTAGGATAHESFIDADDDEWTHRQRVSLKAIDFCPKFGTVACIRPNFGKTGGPIQFGYFRFKDNRRALASELTFLNGVDNWSVTIRPLEQHCRVHYSPEGRVEEFFDGDVGTSRSPHDTQTVLIHFDCPVRLLGFRRFMSSGGPIPLSARPIDDRDSVAYYTHPPYLRDPDGFLSPTVAQGWDPYPYFEPLYRRLPFGWTPVLAPRAPLDISALRYSWSSGQDSDAPTFDNGDSLHEVEITFNEVLGAKPDLAITKHDAGDTVPESGYITYFLDYANQGTASAIDVVIKDPAYSVEPGSEVQRWYNGVEELSTPGWSCSLASCRLELGDLPPGAHGTAELTVQVNRERDVLNDVRIVQEPPVFGRVPLAESRVDNNVATDATPESCDCNDPIETCCVLGWADCSGGQPSILSSGGTTADRDGPRASTGGGLRGLGARLVERATGLFETTGDLLLFYRVRDDVFAKTPGGRRATELYYLHDPEILGLLVADSELRALGLDALATWRPLLAALVDGVDQVAIAQEHMTPVLAFLDALADAASPALSEVIERERDAIGLDTFVDLTLAAALGRLNAFTCIESDTVLCLNQERFRVEARWRKPDGETGPAHAVPLTQDSGFFWFFDDDNIEIVVKALAGCTVNDRFWVFAGGLTNVEVDLTVTDTAAGVVRTYHNAQQTPYQPLQDTGAFSTCAAATATGSGTSAAGTALPVPSTDEIQRALAQRESCVASDTALCVDGGRFRVEASFETSTGVTGEAKAVPLTADAGYFWFFNADNVEVVVKVLNACVVNQHHWVFAAGLTDVEVTIRVVDTVSGLTKTYVNPQKTPFQPLQDIKAFASCE